MLCRRCGAVLANDAQTCRTCGASSIPLAPRATFCPRCGVLRTGAPRCVSCNIDLAVVRTSSPRTPPCPNCQQTSPGGAGFCVNCGRGLHSGALGSRAQVPAPTSGHSASESITARPGDPVASPLLACPQCCQVDRVVKVSSLHRGGISHTSGVGVGGALSEGHVIPGAAVFAGRSQTGTSRLLAPPEKPTSANTCLNAAIGCGGLLAVLGLCTIFSPTPGGSTGDAGVIAFIGFVVAGGAVLLRGEAQQHVHASVTAWQSAMARWDRLFYCARCDGVFVPGSTSLIPAARTQAFCQGGD